MDTDRNTPNERGHVKRAHVKGLLVVATLLGSLAFTSGAATAGTQTEGPVACYTQLPFQEFKYSKTVSTPNSHVEFRWDIETRTEKLQPEINKETRTITSVNPTVWTAWTDWPDAGPVWDDGRTRGPAAHNGVAPGTVGYREYRYVETGNTRSFNPKQYTAWTGSGSTPWGLSSTPPADTATTHYVNKQQKVVDDPPTVTVYLYKDGAWTTDTPGEPWVKIDERTSYKNGDRIPCDKKPDPKVETTSSSTCAPPGSTAATVTTTTTTTDWVLVDYQWVPGTPKVDTSTSYRPLTEEEANDPDCAPPAKVTYTDWVDGRFVCDATTVTQTRTKTTTSYIWVPQSEEDLSVQALRAPTIPSYGRWVLDTDSAVTVTETRTRNLKPEEIVPCPTDPPTTTTPPPPTVPTTTAVEAQSQPPAAAPTTTTQPPSAAAPAGGLPSTGGSSLTMALIALVVLLGGTALVRLGRRSTD